MPSEQRCRPAAIAGSRAAIAPLGPRSRAFTLTEMLVVIGIIVLIVVMALPAMRSITGTRSVDAAYNQLSAVMARAHEDALGLQDYRGVLFYVDPGSDRVTCAEVMAVPQAGAPAVEVMLDLTPNRDYLVLPQGIGVQTVNNSSTTYTDRYIGFNPVTSSSPVTRFGGVVLFDGAGRLVSRSFGLKMTVTGGTNPTTGDNRTNMAVMLNCPASTADFIPAVAMRSQFGFVVYDREAFKNAGGTDGDPTLDAAASAGTETTEETWLDSNSTPVLINRYTGTLVRGE